MNVGAIGHKIAARGLTAAGGSCIFWDMNLMEQLAAAEMKKAQGNWFPACGGTEVPFMTRNGYRLLYCWQPSTGRHAYLNLGTDIILTDEEAALALGIF